MKHYVEKTFGHEIDLLKLSQLQELLKCIKMNKAMHNNSGKDFNVLSNRNSNRQSYKITRGFCTKNDKGDSVKDLISPPKQDSNSDLTDLNYDDDDIFSLDQDFMTAPVDAKPTRNLIDDNGDMEDFGQNFSHQLLDDDADELTVDRSHGLRYKWISSLKDVRDNEELLRRVKDFLGAITVSPASDEFQLAVTALLDLEAESYNPKLASGFLVFHSLFHQESQGVAVDPHSLNIVFDTNLGKIEKNYSKYLSRSVFPQNLGDAAYKKLLDHQVKNFKRKEFKRVMSHFALFSDKSGFNFPATLGMVSEICLEKKIPLTLLEFYYLVNFNGGKFSINEFRKMIDVLSKFKYYNDDILEISKKYVRDNDQASLNVDLLEPYIDMLIATNKTESLMFTLDRMKEYIDSNKFQIIKTLSSKENTIKEEAHQVHLENLTKSLFKNFLNKLLSKDLKTESS